jgi:predicted RNA-binding Zn-ribbon protein involved in translation (DUF1610 family)
MDEKKEGLYYQWKCWYCNVDLGWQPKVIRIICPVCGKENILPGLEMATKNQSKSLQAIKEQAKKDAQERYKAMRER